jgi:hypothetical protein
LFNKTSLLRSIFICVGLNLGKGMKKISHLLFAGGRASWHQQRLAQREPVLSVSRWKRSLRSFHALQVISWSVLVNRIVYPSLIKLWRLMK